MPNQQTISDPEFIFLNCNFVAVNYNLLLNKIDSNTVRKNNIQIEHNNIDIMFIK